MNAAIDTVMEQLTDTAAQCIDEQVKASAAAGKFARPSALLIKQYTLPSGRIDVHSMGAALSQQFTASYGKVTAKENKPLSKAIQNALDAEKNAFNRIGKDEQWMEDNGGQLFITSKPKTTGKGDSKKFERVVTVEFKSHAMLEIEADIAEKEKALQDERDAALAAEMERAAQHERDNMPVDDIAAAYCQDIIDNYGDRMGEILAAMVHRHQQELMQPETETAAA